MDKDVFLERVNLQFEDLDENLGFDAVFRDFGSYDSLTGMAIMVMLKDNYGVDITENEYRSKKTIEELYNFVIEKSR